MTTQQLIETVQPEHMSTLSTCTSEHYATYYNIMFLCISSYSD